MSESSSRPTPRVASFDFGALQLMVRTEIARSSSGVIESRLYDRDVLKRVHTHSVDDNGDLQRVLDDFHDQHVRDVVNEFSKAQ
jgi:hypothetical protein